MGYAKGCNFTNCYRDSRHTHASLMRLLPVANIVNLPTKQQKSRDQVRLHHTQDDDKRKLRVQAAVAYRSEARSKTTLHKAV